MRTISFVYVGAACHALLAPTTLSTGALRLRAPQGLLSTHHHSRPPFPQTLLHATNDDTAAATVDPGDEEDVMAAVKDECADALRRFDARIAANDGASELLLKCRVSSARRAPTADSASVAARAAPAVARAYLVSKQDVQTDLPHQ